MPKVKTHFEQVPLEVVRTVIEEQIWREAKIEQEQRLREKMIAKKGVVVAKQSRAESDKSSQAEASKEVYEAQQ
jgi:hypothetical protein